MIKHNFLKNLSVLLFSLIFSYMLGELIAYSRYRKKMGLFPRFVTKASYGDFRIRKNVPNAHYFHKSFDGKWEFCINSKGFRDKREFQYNKPKGTIRILTLGDSFTIGYEVQQNETYSAIIEKYLKSKGFNVEVINAGVSGFSTAEELIFLEQEGIKYEPDVVILGFYINDFEENVRSDLFHLVDGEIFLNKTEYLPAIKIRNFLNSFFFYRWLSEHSYLHNHLNRCATVYVRKIITKKNENKILNGSKNLALKYREQLTLKLVKRIYSITKSNNIYFVLLDIHTKNLEPSFRISEEFENTNFADLYLNSIDILKEYKDLTNLYRPHGHDHWSDFSHLIVGKSLVETLEKHLKNSILKTP